MLLDLGSLLASHDLLVESVIHVGAHTGQEAETYARLGIDRVTWLEANPQVIPRLREHVAPFGHTVLGAAVSDRSGVPVEFHVTNNEQSSSMLPLGTHRYEHPEIMVTESLELTTTTLDELLVRGMLQPATLLMLDVQGAELLVLRGGVQVLEHATCVYAEVNERPLYAGAVLLPELDAFLHEQGFERVEMVLTEHGWGDAFYLRPGRESTAELAVEPVGTTSRRESLRLRFSPRQRLAMKVRGVASEAVAPRLESTDVAIARLEHRISIMEQMVVQNDRELAAVRTQLEECIRVLRANERGPNRPN